MNTVLAPLPPLRRDLLETTQILRKTASAHRYLAELKGVSCSIPNDGILINTLSLQEAKDSSAIESIITTNDELFRDELFPEFATSAATKEVRNYVTALRTGFDTVNKKNYSPPMVFSKYTLNSKKTAQGSASCPVQN